METIGFVGLGQMGLAMALNLQKAGYALRVYNRTSEKAKSLTEKGATLEESAAKVAQSGGIFITMLTDSLAM